MLQGRLSRTIALAVLLPLLLLNVGSARALYRCAFDNVARSECCCPPTAAKLPVQGSTATKSCCCKVESSKAGPVPAQARVERSEASKLRIPVVLVALLRPDFALHRSVADAQRAYPKSDPPIGPPLILLKRSFLI
jgi:hypothetical protein